jgi:hypothetical protein
VVILKLEINRMLVMKLIYGKNVLVSLIVKPIDRITLKYEDRLEKNEGAYLTLHFLFDKHFILDR